MRKEEDVFLHSLWDWSNSLDFSVIKRRILTLKVQLFHKNRRKVRIMQTHTEGSVKQKKAKTKLKNKVCPSTLERVGRMFWLLVARQDRIQPTEQESSVSGSKLQDWEAASLPAAHLATPGTGDRPCLGVQHGLVLSPPPRHSRPPSSSSFSTSSLHRVNSETRFISVTLIKPSGGGRTTPRLLAQCGTAQISFKLARRVRGVCRCR